MKKGLRAIRLMLLAIIAGILAIPIPAFAIADPDSPPQINAVYVYQDLLETGDVGVLVDHFLDYAVPPTETVTEAFMVVFIDTDGTTQLRAVAPYTFLPPGDNGYGRGQSWIYFSAADATTFGLTSANKALYRIWLVGNPTLAWPTTPPKTIGSIDDWFTTGDPHVLLAQRILGLGIQLETIWSLDIVEQTALGTRLTTTGEQYFQGVITNLRSLAPAAFSSATYNQSVQDINGATSFGAIMANGTGTVAGSPITLVSGTQLVNVTVAGTFTLTLNKGTVGTISSVGGGGTVNGSPVSLVAGVNTVTVPGGGIGNLSVTVALQNTQTQIDSGITGTAFDASTAAAQWGMSREMFTGLAWLAVSIIICAAVYNMQSKQGINLGGGKVVLLVFDLCIIGGAVLSLIPILVAILLFIGFGVLTAYVLFFKYANV